jgi:hypothetical protein
VITTDHGRDSETGHNHGGQSDRERLTWIVTNASQRNARFDQNPGIVDIFPTICHHLDLKIPDDVNCEVDGVPFIGPIDLSGLRAEKMDDKIVLRWTDMDENGSENAEVFISETNNFKNGGKDDYRKLGEVLVSQETFDLPLEGSGSFYKILLKTPRQCANVWVTDNKVDQ